MATGRDDGSVFSWKFNSVKDLRRALEEYLDGLDNTVTTRYGLLTGGEQDPEVQMHAAQRRSEVDVCMDALLCSNPLLWRVLDVYFRRGGVSSPEAGRSRQHA